MICLILHTFLNCTGSPLSTKEKPDYALGWNYIFWAIIKPEQDRLASCARPNAIGFEYVDNNGNKVYCLNNKVSQGLILDALTNMPITAETIIAGQSLFCSCGSTSSIGGQWQRGSKVEDNPSNGVPISFIMYGNINAPLKYQTNYNQSDNLYCIKTCPSNSVSFQYQFIKIR